MDHNHLFGTRNTQVGHYRKSSCSLETASQSCCFFFFLLFQSLQTLPQQGYKWSHFFQGCCCAHLTGRHALGVEKICWNCRTFGIGTLAKIGWNTRIFASVPMDFTIAGEWTRAGVGPRSLWSDCSEHQTNSFIGLVLKLCCP